MMRSLLLWLSRNKNARSWITRWGLVRRAARRFVAGETIEGAIQAIRDLNALGITATLDHLGENVESTEDERRSLQDIDIQPHPPVATQPIIILFSRRRITL